MSKSETVLLVDVSNLLHADAHAAAEWGLKPMRKRLAIWRQRFHEVFLCWDFGTSFRKSISAEYKATRPEAGDSSARDLAFRHMEELWAETGGVRAEGFEADDVIATLAAEAVAEGQRVVIVSADKDLWQCLEDGKVTCQTKWRQGGYAYLTAAGFRERWGVEPAQWPDFLALVGDKSDNIIGANGVGRQTAAKWLQRHGNLPEIIRALNVSQLGANGAQLAAMEEFSKRWEANLRLATLRRDVPWRMSVMHGLCNE